MGCSGVLTHKYFDSALNKQLSSNFSIIFDDEIGITPSEQNASMYTILTAVAGSCGVAVNDENVKYKFNYVDSNKEHIYNQDVKCDIQFIVEYFGDYVRYAKYTSAIVKNISPESRGAYLKQAINDFVSSIIGSTDSVNKVTNWRIKSANVSVHLGVGNEPTPEPINLYNGFASEGYIWNDSDHIFDEDASYGFTNHIPVQNGASYDFKTTPVDAGYIYIIGWNETSPDTYVYKELLVNDEITDISDYETSIIIPPNVTHVVINMKLTNTNTFFGLPVSE